MRKILFVGIALLVIGASSSLAQFKSQVERESRVSEGLVEQPSASFLFGWFDPERFHMRHSLSMSYQTFGGEGISMGTYTNSMSYEFSDKLNAQADVSLSYSPYNTFSGFGKKGNDMSSIYLSRAQVSYRPWENVMIQVQYRQIPYGYGYYSPFYDPWYKEGRF